MKWHLIEIDAALQELNSDPQQGLTSSDAAGRLERYGLNELVEKGGRLPLQILWEQFTAPLLLMLVAAAALAAWLGDLRVTACLGALVVAYAVLGYVQDYRAERAIAALRRMSVPHVRVIRDGAPRKISARGLVPGDILQLEAGDVVTADVRLLEAVNLRVQESALTGETEPVGKHTAALPGGHRDGQSADDLPLGDRRNMAFLGTAVAQGRGLALVVATGMQTELGRIAELIQASSPGPTSLRRRLDALGWGLAIAAAALAAVIFTADWLRAEALRQTLRTILPVIVALVPEGLPVVVTFMLIIAARRIREHNALVRKLPAVETLGAVSVICSDKTGTLTENRMTVLALDAADHQLDLTQELRKGGMVRMANDPSVAATGSLSLMAIGVALCNDAQLMDEGDDRFHTLGDPTEGALVVAAARIGYWKSSLDLAFPRAADLPFDPDRKRMTTVHYLKDYHAEMLAGLDIGSHHYIAFTKGSADGLLALSSRVWADGHFVRMNNAWRARIRAANERLSGKGMRVLAVAFRLLEKVPDILQTELESNLTFIGQFGMVDPPRADVRYAVERAQAAGIRTVMITGDQPVNALEIARELGISRADGGRTRSDVLTGPELDRLTGDELTSVVEDVRVFARVSPEHKLKIVQALQARGHVVAMTGDGVNDAPALRRADVGLAMGLSGTDVSKEAADLVVLDDNFATIVAAVAEGRRVHANLGRFVSFAAAGNLAKALVLLGLFLGGLIPMLPLQLLWLNLLVDGPLGLGLALAPAAAEAMRRTPPSPAERRDSRADSARAVWRAALIGTPALVLGLWYFAAGRGEWQTMAFACLAFAQIGQALAAYYGGGRHLLEALRENPQVAYMALSAFILPAVAIYVPAVRHLLGLASLPAGDLAIALAAGGLVFGALTAGKSQLP